MSGGEGEEDWSSAKATRNDVGVTRRSPSRSASHGTIIVLATHSYGLMRDGKMDMGFADEHVAATDSPGCADGPCVLRDEHLSS